MKVFTILALCLATLTISCRAEDANDDATLAAKEEVTVEDFKTKLTPYGTWVKDPDLGLVWQPNEAANDADWRPYQDGGHWVYTEYGWYFESDYAWSWAGFHYGRWTRHAHLHWVWVPGTTWGPSWVAWRTSGEAYGWAPLPPACEFRAGVGFCFHGNHVGFDFEFGLGFDDFCFCPCGSFLEINLGHHCYKRRDCERIYNHTTVIKNTTIIHNKTVINNGLSRRDVARVTKRNIEVTHARSVPAHIERERKIERQERQEKRQEQRHENREQRHEQRQEHREQRQEQRQQHHEAQPHNHHEVAPPPARHK